MNSGWLHWILFFHSSGSEIQWLFQFAAMSSSSHGAHESSLPVPPFTDALPNAVSEAFVWEENSAAGPAPRKPPSLQCQGYPCSVYSCDAKVKCWLAAGSADTQDTCKRSGYGSRMRCKLRNEAKERSLSELESLRDSAANFMASQVAAGSGDGQDGLPRPAPTDNYDGSQRWSKQWATSNDQGNFQSQREVAWGERDPEIRPEAIKDVCCHPWRTKGSKLKTIPQKRRSCDPNTLQAWTDVMQLAWNDAALARLWFCSWKDAAYEGFCKNQDVFGKKMFFLISWTLREFFPYFSSYSKQVCFRLSFFNHVCDRSPFFPPEMLWYILSI